MPSCRLGANARSAASELGVTHAYETATHLSLPLLRWGSDAILAARAVAGHPRLRPAALPFRVVLDTRRRVLRDGRHRVGAGPVRVHGGRGATAGHAESLDPRGRDVRCWCFARFSTVLIPAAAQAGGATEPVVASDRAGVTPPRRSTRSLNHGV